MAKRTNTRSKKNQSKTRVKSVLVDTQAIRQLQVYRYPFSVATSNPKVPDGKLTSSLGLKIQHVGSNQAADQLFVMAPLLNHHGHRYTVGTTTRENVTWNLGSRSTTAADGVNKLVTFDHFAEDYRIVSKALKLRCISSDDFNDGYWEAIRIPSNDRKRNYFQNPVATATPGEYEIKEVAAYPAYLTTLIAKQNWLINPTYQSGKIKNLGQYEFRLQPEKEEHEMISVPHHIEYKAAEINADTGELLTDGHDLAHLFDFLTDDQFDTIAIRIHGRAETQILSHWVTNVEVRPREQSEANVFSTECVDSGYSLKNRQLEFKREERLPGKYVGGPRNS
jgi:hypothetical protein